MTWTYFWHQFAQYVNNLTLYDLTSGWIPCCAIVTGVITAFRRWNCNERFCLRHGYAHPEHGRPVCGKHYQSHDPKLGDSVEEA